MSVPTITKVFALSSFAAVIEILVPDVVPKAGVVPTFIEVAAASDAIFVTVLKNLVP